MSNKPASQEPQQSPEEHIGQLMQALSKTSHRSLSITHTRGLGFDTSVWTVTINDYGHTDADLAKALEKAVHSSQHLEKK